MKRLPFFLLSLLAVVFLTGSAGQPPITVRFFAEANQQDTERFAAPAHLQYPTPHSAFIERIPTVSERDIVSIYPFPAADGTWGCAFKLEESGKLHLYVLSTERKGSSLVVFVQTKLYVRQVIDMVIDKPNDDGIISIPRGFTQPEIAMLSKQFRVMGSKKK